MSIFIEDNIECRLLIYCATWNVVLDIYWHKEEKDENAADANTSMWGKNVGMADNKLSRNAVNHWARRRISENTQRLRSDRFYSPSVCMFIHIGWVPHAWVWCSLSELKGLKVSLNSLYITRQPSNEGIVYRCVSGCLLNVSTLDLLIKAWIVLSVWSEQCVNVGE